MSQGNKTRQTPRTKYRATATAGRTSDISLAFAPSWPGLPSPPPSEHPLLLAASPTTSFGRYTVVVVHLKGNQ